MKNKAVTHYFLSLVQQIRNIQSQNTSTYTYKIVGKEFNKKLNHDELIIQVTGKNVFIKMTPQALVHDETVLKGFSPLDVRTITYLACQPETPKKGKKSFYKIVAQFFSKNKKEEMFILQGENSAIRIAKTAQEISNNPDLIQKLNSIDAHKVGYVAGSEQIIIEQEIMKNKHSEFNQG